MTHQTPLEHFKGKSVSEHLKDARIKGAMAIAEAHGTELPGYFSASMDSAKTTAAVYLLLWAVVLAFHLEPYFVLLSLICFALGWTIWNTGRSALLGWSRLERLHRLVEEERWEIEHNRDEEKKELREMYASKGFSGKLLDEVVNVLVADDNRLLRVMLEEELGLSLEIYEHPLKQALGAALGSFITAILMILSYYFWMNYGVPILAVIIVMICSNVTAKYEKRDRLRSVIWNTALALFATASVYFLARFMQ